MIVQNDSQYTSPCRDSFKDSKENVKNRVSSDELVSFSTSIDIKSDINLEFGINYTLVIKLIIKTDVILFINFIWSGNSNDKFNIIQLHPSGEACSSIYVIQSVTILRNEWSSCLVNANCLSPCSFERTKRYVPTWPCMQGMWLHGWSWHEWLLFGGF